MLLGLYKHLVPLNPVFNKADALVNCIPPSHSKQPFPLLLVSLKDFFFTYHKFHVYPYDFILCTYMCDNDMKLLQYQDILCPFTGFK